MWAEDARKASGTMAPVATRVSVTLVGRAAPSSGSLSIGPLPRRDESRTGPRPPVLHPQISHPSDRPSPCRHWHTTQLTTRMGGFPGATGWRLAGPANFRTCRQTLPEAGRISRISVEREVTTALARIGTITAHRNKIG